MSGQPARTDTRKQDNEPSDTPALGGEARERAGADEWLLDQYDNDDRRHTLAPYQKRPMFQVLDDHPPDECVPPTGRCQHWSGEASWPVATTGRSLGAADRSAA